MARSRPPSGRDSRGPPTRRSTNPSISPMSAVSPPPASRSRSPPPAPITCSSPAHPAAARPCSLAASPRSWRPSTPTKRSRSPASRPSPVATHRADSRRDDRSGPRTTPRRLPPSWAAARADPDPARSRSRTAASSSSTSSASSRRSPWTRSANRSRRAPSASPGRARASCSPRASCWSAAPTRARAGGSRASVAAPTSPDCGTPVASSAPLLDRFDLRLRITGPAARDRPGEGSAVVAERVAAAAARQRHRLRGTPWRWNREIPAACIDRFVALSGAGIDAWHVAVEDGLLTGRGASRVRRVAAHDRGSGRRGDRRRRARGARGVVATGRAVSDRDVEIAARSRW